MKFILVCFASVFVASCAGKNDDHSKPVSDSETLQKSTGCFSDTDTVPTNPGSGCARDFLYKPIGDNRYLIVQFDRREVKLDSTCIRYKLEEEKGKITVRVDDFGTTGNSFSPGYCSDIKIINQPAPRTYFSRKGFVSISETSGVNVLLEDLVLEDTVTQKQIFIEKEIFYQVDVSNVPG